MSRRLLFVLLVGTLLVSTPHAQNLPDPAKMQAEAGIPALYLIPISATGASNAQVTLTIPAPPAGMYNYVCKVDLQMSNDNVGTGALTNVTWTATNFPMSTIWKASAAGTARTNYDHASDYGNPTTGCAKSTAPGTTTTIVSPSAVANDQFTISAMYFQGK